MAETWAVIGAGPHGMSVLKALQQVGVAAVGFEQAGDVGGMWNFGAPQSRVHEGLHTVTTKPFTQFPDFPMPADYPDYPSHSQIQHYLRRYASHFGLYDRIRFGCEALSLVPVGEFLELTIRDVLTDKTSTSRYAGVVIATGKTQCPRLPRYPGQNYLDRPILHAADFASADQLRGKRVLVVGAGTSGCEIAVESALSAAETFHSSRSGYRLVPKYLFGRPTDQLVDLLHLLPVPQGVRRSVIGAMARVLVGQPPGSPHSHRPDPVVNQLLAYYVRHGRVVPKPDVEQFAEGEVVFTDNSTAQVDLVVFATGYETRFPFVHPSLLRISQEEPVLGLNMFSTAHPAVVVSGMIEPTAGQWTLAHWQAMLIAQYARVRRDRPQAARTFATELRLLDSAGLRVAHQEYLRALEAKIRELECLT